MIIFSSQVKDLFGLSIERFPPSSSRSGPHSGMARESLNVSRHRVAGVALALIVGLRRYAPRLPAFLVAVVGASVAVYVLACRLIPSGRSSAAYRVPCRCPVCPRLQRRGSESFAIGSHHRLPRGCREPAIGRGCRWYDRPATPVELRAGCTGHRKCLSAMFGGMPATGAIARTATNIRSGARSPIAGMMHAVFLLLFMLVLAPLAVYVPLASLAAVLVVVAWNMSEVHKFRHLMRAPLGDRAVLLVTFALTVLVDLTVAIEVGVVLAAILFMHRMAEVASVRQGAPFLEEDVDDFERPRTDTYTQRALAAHGCRGVSVARTTVLRVGRPVSRLLDSIGTPRAYSSSACARCR